MGVVCKFYNNSSLLVDGTVDSKMHNNRTIPLFIETGKNGKYIIQVEAL